MISLNQETLTPPPDDVSSKTVTPNEAELKTPIAVVKMESSMRDDKRPEESLNSGENHVKEALSDLKSFDSHVDATHVASALSKLSVP